MIWWCTPTDYVVHYDGYAWYDVMMHSYALWCTLYVNDACMMHTEMMMYIWWWGCIPYDDDAYAMTMMNIYDDDAWRWMPYVQWKQTRITCSVIMYDEVYNDVHEQCMVVKWLISIQWWTWQW